MKTKSQKQVLLYYELCKILDIFVWFWSMSRYLSLQCCFFWTDAVESWRREKLEEAKKSMNSTSPPEEAGIYAFSSTGCAFGVKFQVFCMLRSVAYSWLATKLGCQFLALVLSWCGCRDASESLGVQLGGAIWGNWTLDANWGVLQGTRR